MSQKRKLEEFHDPDYPQGNENKRKYNPPLQPEERIEKIRSIIKREFQNELNIKEQEIMEIDNRLFSAKILLHKVRYAVVADYYGKGELDVNEADLWPDSNNSDLPDATKGIQKPIHPALKSILGKKPEDYDEILRIRPPRAAAKTAKNSIREKLMTKKEEKRLQREKSGALQKQTAQSDLSESWKVPRHIEPIKVDKPVPKLNSNRGRNQSKHLIVVGNTSKFVGNENSSDHATHKWLIYVQTRTAVPIEQIVKKVRFFLHPSYRPNDIIDVSSPPFQLSRRGWGEFPVRIQLFFDPKLQQKPVQLVHNLVLDKTQSGLQTMGAETLVEIWLCLDHLTPPCTSMETNTTVKVKSEICEEPAPAMTPELNSLEDNLLEFLNTIEKQNPSICPEGDKIEPTITCSPIIDNGIIPPEKISLSPVPNIKVENKNLGESTESNPNPPKEENSSIEKSQFNFDIGAEQVISNTCENITLPARNTTPIATPPKVFQKKLVKCIDKQGNVKLIPMLVSANPIVTTQSTLQRGQVTIQQNGQVKVQQSGQTISQPNLQTTSGQNGMNTGPKKTFIITKLNGQNSSIAVQQPTVFKIVPSGANLSNNKMLTNQVFPPMKLIQNGGNQTNVINNNNNVKATQKINASNQLLKESFKEGNHITTQASQNSINSGLNSQSVFSVGGNQQPKTSIPTVFNQRTVSNLCKNQVFMKDGKMYIIDPLQSKIKQQSKKQESLLKPQVSLLKPIVKNDNLTNCIRNNSSQVFNHTALATDHDYTSLVASKPSTSNAIVINRPLSLISQRSSIVTVSSPDNSSINVIVTQNEPIVKGISALNSKTFATQKPILMQKPRRNYAKELEDKFLNLHFIGIRHAVEYLLKQLPLINELAMNSDYKMSYPFVVSSEKIFNSLITPKKKCYEWLRAKYISQLIQKHNDVKSLEQWTTRELILFARYHAYSPVISYSKDSVPKDLENNNETLKDLVKREIKKEKINIRTLTSAQDVQHWISSMKEKLKDRLSCSEEVINVEDSDSEEDVRQMNKNKVSPIKNFSNKYWLPVASNLEKECSLVNEKCYEIGIRLQPEEIISGVMHSSAEVALAQALRSFIEDLVRRSLCKKIELEGESSMLESSLQLDDIKSAILGRPQFDFLTNKDLGILNIKEEKAGTG